MPLISVIIPTRNRPESLLLSLAALKAQEHEILEVLVVDSSDQAPDEGQLQERSGLKNLRLIRSAPSVCAQRNIGIRSARGEFLLLLDDDISLEAHYPVTLLRHLQTHPEWQVVSGLVMEKDERGEWQYKKKPPHLLKLLWRALFQLGLWADLSEQNASRPWRGLYSALQAYYARCNNGISKAGWPLISSFHAPVFYTRVYGLGASMIRRDWLIEHLYDEHLDRHGIGDNYGIAMALKPEQGIMVLTTCKAFHHKSQGNRLAGDKAYYNRVLALDYFSTHFKSASRAWLCWSLFGNALASFLQAEPGRFLKNLTLIWLIGTKQNPLLKAESLNAKIKGV